MKDIHKLGVAYHSTSMYAISCSWNTQYSMTVDIKGQFWRRLSQEFSVSCNFSESASSISWGWSWTLPSVIGLHVCNVSWTKYLPVRRKGDHITQGSTFKRDQIPLASSSGKTQKYQAKNMKKRGKTCSIQNKDDMFNRTNIVICYVTQTFVSNADMFPSVRLGYLEKEILWNYPQMKCRSGNSKYKGPSIKIRHYMRWNEGEDISKRQRDHTGSQKQRIDTPNAKIDITSETKKYGNLQIAIQIGSN